jgi:plastocyanin
MLIVLTKRLFVVIIKKDNYRKIKKMKKAIICLILIIILIIAAISIDIFFMYSQNNKNDNPGTSPIAQTGGNVVSVENFAFSPSTLTIAKGTTVTWTNNDSASHQIKSDTFESILLSKGQSYFYTFNEVGTFEYICSAHPSMKGKVIVR